MDDSRIVQLSLALDAAAPDAATANLIEAELERQRVALYQFIGQMRVLSAQLSGGYSVDRSAVSESFQWLHQRYLTGEWLDFDCACDMEDLVMDTQPGEAVLEEDDLVGPLSQLFWALTLPSEDGHYAWARVRSALDGLIHDCGDVVVVGQKTAVIAVCLEPDIDGGSVSPVARAALRLAALPRAVRELFSLYRDDELAYSPQANQGYWFG